MYILGLVCAAIIGFLFLVVMRKISRRGKLPKAVVFILYPIIIVTSWVGVGITVFGFLVLVINLIVESEWWDEDF